MELLSGLPHKQLLKEGASQSVLRVLGLLPALSLTGQLTCLLPV